MTKSRSQFSGGEKGADEKKQLVTTTRILMMPLGKKYSKANDEQRAEVWRRRAKNEFNLSFS